MILSIYFTFPLILLSSFCATSDIQMRIVGGKTTTISTARYMVAILDNKRYTCAGSLVSLRHVLTAAHCLVGKKAGAFIVKAGASNLKQSGQTRSAKRLYYSKAFTSKTKNRDVGMIVLRQAFTAGPKVATIPLCKQKLTAKTAMRVSGWGTTSERRSAASNQLRTATVQFVKRRTCARQYRRVGQPLTRSMVCAGRGSKDACSGDSGAPGVVNGQVCTVVSFGMGCARKNFAGIYTSLNNRAVRRLVLKWMKR